MTFFPSNAWSPLPDERISSLDLQIAWPPWFFHVAPAYNSEPDIFHRQVLLPRIGNIPTVCEHILPIVYSPDKARFAFRALTGSRCESFSILYFFRVRSLNLFLVPEKITALFQFLFLRFSRINRLKRVRMKSRIINFCSQSHWSRRKILNLLRIIIHFFNDSR